MSDLSELRQETAGLVDAAASADAAARKLSVWQRLARNQSVVIGGAVMAVMLLVAIMAPFLGTMDPAEINPAWRNKVPGTELTATAADGSQGWVYRMGTDTLGRDTYSRVIYGTRVSLIVGLSVAGLSIAIGLVVGLVSGYVRWLDGIIMRVMDGLMAIPASCWRSPWSRCRVPAWIR